MDISFIIVCMNKPQQLAVCLDSIRSQTQASYEVLVAAYLFSDANLAWLREHYPWVRTVVSDQIRGFAENNNLCLRQAQGEYCMVINDDTELRMPVADRLLDAFRSQRVPERCAVMSPRIVWPDGRTQSCGVAPKKFRETMLECFRLWHRNDPSPYTNQTGIFRSYNIHGAAFMIRTEVFRELGWFDERFFFCPEDIALSTLANERGYECWVDADAEIVHFEGLSSRSLSRIQTATRPASTRGTLLWLGTTPTKRILLSIALICYYLPKVIVFGLKMKVSRSEQDAIKAISSWHSIRTVFSNRTAKEIFTYYYSQINNHA